MFPAIILIAAGLITTCFTIGKEELRPVSVAAIIVVVIACVACMILQKLYTSPGNELESRWRAYSAIPRDKITDFAAELEEVRKNYEEDTDPNKNYVGKFKAFKGERPVQETGKIYYAHLVEANSALFKRNFSSFTLPGVVVYSKDEYYAKNPYELAETAGRLYANKRNNLLKNELKYFYNEKMTDEQGRELFITTIFLHRFHLPDGYLRGSLFPVIADPENCKAVFAVDSIYWTEKLIANFMWHDISYPEPEPEQPGDASDGAPDGDVFDV